MHFVPIKTVEQQSMLCIHRLREGFKTERTACVDRIRCLLAEFGLVFAHKALAAVFRGKLLAALNAHGLTAPVCLPGRWVVDCRAVGNGHKTLVYLGRYLCRGVIQERDIVRCADGQVTLRYRDSTRGKNTLRTVSGVHFLWLVLQHVLPRGLRRSRNFGLLHPNCKHRQRLVLLRLRRRLAATLRCPAGAPPSAAAPPFTPPALSERPRLQCRCCGSAMEIVRRRIAASAPQSGTPGPPGAVREEYVH